jgi:hypothetical protein
MPHPCTKRHILILLNFLIFSSLKPFEELVLRFHLNNKIDFQYRKQNAVQVQTIFSAKNYNNLSCRWRQQDFQNYGNFLAKYKLVHRRSTGPGVASWLRLRATSQRVSGLIPGAFAEDFFRGFDGTMCPGVNSASKNEYQELPGGKDGRCVRVTTLQPSCAECREDPGVLTFWNPRSLPRLVAGNLYLFYHYIVEAVWLIITATNISHLLQTFNVLSRNNSCLW